MAKIVMKPVESALKTHVTMSTEFALMDAQRALWQISVKQVCYTMNLYHVNKLATLHKHDLQPRQIFIEWNSSYFVFNKKIFSRLLNVFINDNQFVLQGAKMDVMVETVSLTVVETV